MHRPSHQDLTQHFLKSPASKPSISRFFSLVFHPLCRLPFHVFLLVFFPLSPLAHLPLCICPLFDLFPSLLWLTTFNPFIFSLLPCFHPAQSSPTFFPSLVLMIPVPSGVLWGKMGVSWGIFQLCDADLH
ncbi:hypothetical protein GDO81_029260 [Engystomops pustulosus]|uniref:Uncharacterized protein n=1 Tax=Engystomops pustulosus TaxID=76066 RepID=A0AAV6YCX2_ENGPU|nr:hypothetical protein GDO81_029260 [Engystomops pustulosus]